MADKKLVRLDRLLRNLGFLTGKHGLSKFSKQNEISLDGQPLGFLKKSIHVDPLKITINGERLKYLDPLNIIVNKPAHIDPYQLLPPQFAYRKPTFLMPLMLLENCGGMLLMTQVYEVFKRATSIKNPLRRVYEIVTEDAYTGLEEEAIRLIRGEVKNSLKKVIPPPEFKVIDKDNNVARLTLYDYKPDNLYALLMSIRHKPVSIKRTTIGNLELGDLEEGKWKRLTSSEMKLLLPPTRKPPPKTFDEQLKSLYKKKLKFLEEEKEDRKAVEEFLEEAFREEFTNEEKDDEDKPKEKKKKTKKLKFI